jgi:hypothetical protein
MKKLKTINEFKASGLELKSEALLSVNGGLLAETYHFESTCKNDVADRIRCSMQDNPDLPNYHEQHCINVALLP